MARTDDSWKASLDDYITRVDDDSERYNLSDDDRCIDCNQPLSALDDEYCPDCRKQARSDERRNFHKRH